jgi:hypothetical protein
VKAKLVGNTEGWDMERFLLLFFAVVIVLIIPMLAWHFRQSRKLVDRWAAANAYTIIKIERRFFRVGPFFWRRSRGQEVFYVVVSDARGEQRGAYVRSGGWFLGQLSKQVAVKWDDVGMN